MSADIEFGLPLVAFLGIVVLCAKPLGGYIAAVMAMDAEGIFEARLQ